MRKLAFLLLIWSTAVQAQTLDTQQLLVVTTPTLTSVTGTLRTYEWNQIQQQWKQARPPQAVVVGKNGLAWDRKHPLASPPYKQEGDGKAPAGVFRLGTAFGTESKPAALHWPYVQTNRSCFCVDDARSRHYNQLVHTDSVRKDWTSAERMFIPDYKYGLVLAYNTDSPQAGAGSCIFMHLWENPTHGTAGCTAMTETDMLSILRWLDPVKKPLLIQMPEPDYDRLKRLYALPE
ncbi:hypothetical protein BWI93_00025 [Siphonobacter sp. BAB-5385]|uniref:L,D-transpeptidase family protein n=1 Tax=Siphonobacter sp. BAB-5385 TaxID=1864822 RepID=UPI000B9E9479|nr:L,D-transpeptidase family protein [Siphonobacter sp. BAB-5385]OZI10155.1 hypothetical protein BWI93_00025 [Siphonobacter sp. BAB-5385]